MRRLVEGLLFIFLAWSFHASAQESAFDIDHVPSAAWTKLSMPWSDLKTPNAALFMPLPDGRFLVFATEVKTLHPGVTQIIGRGSAGEHLFIFRSPRSTTGIVQGLDYQFRLTEAGGEYLWINSQYLPRRPAPLMDDVVESPPASPDLPAAAVKSITTPASTIGNAQVDMLVLYTSRAKGLMGGDIGMRQYAAETLAYAHGAFAASGVPQEYRVVYMQEYATTDTQGDSTFEGNLSQMRGDAVVTALRNDYGADLIALLRGPNNSLCGQAYLYTGPANGGPHQGYSATSVRCPSSVAHELGHNMGSLHERVGLGTFPATAWKPYAFAWNCGDFYSIMHYGTLGLTGVEGQFFSNPSLVKNGQSCGSTTPQNEADNSRAHRDALPFVSQNRPTMPAPATYSMETGNINVSNTASSVTLKVLRTGNATETGSVEIYTLNDPDGPTPASPGTDYTEKLERLTFASGETEKTFTIALVPKTSTAPRKFFAVLDFPLRGALGSTSNSAITIAASTPPSVMLGSNKISAQTGDMVTLTWSSTDATSCTASGAWSGTKPTAGEETLNVGSTAGSNSYTLTCTGSGGSNAKTVTVNVTAAPAPALTLIGNKTSAQTGETVTLTWSSTDATSCTASGAWSGTKATTGNETLNVGSTAGSNNYTLTCTGSGGSDAKTVTVNVTAASQPAAPSLTFTGNKTSAQTGEAVSLTWSSANTSGCSASGDWSGNKAISGSENISVGSTAGNRTYTLICTGSSSGSVERSVNLTVTGASAPPPSGDLGSGASTKSGAWSLSSGLLLLAGALWRLRVRRALEKSGLYKRTATISTDRISHRSGNSGLNVGLSAGRPFLLYTARFAKRDDDG